MVKAGNIMTPLVSQNHALPVLQCSDVSVCHISLGQCLQDLVCVALSCALIAQFQTVTAAQHM